jgi:hypothetical protein
MFFFPLRINVKIIFPGNVKIIKWILVRIHSFSVSADYCLIDLSFSCVFSTTLIPLHYFHWTERKNIFHKLENYKKLGEKDGNFNLILMLIQTFLCLILWRKFNYRKLCNLWSIEWHLSPTKQSVFNF